MVDEHTTVNGKNADPIILSNDNIQDVLIQSGISEEITAKIEKSYEREFGDTPPVVENLIDKKVLAANEQRKKEERLEKKVQILEERLERTKQNSELDSEGEAAFEPETDSNFEQEKEVALETNADTILEIKTDIDSKTESETNLDTTSETETEPEEHTKPNYDIVLHVKPQKVPQIKSQIIDGKKCIVIPLEENEQANVNGVNALL
jgi:hypothetical protein